MTHFLILYLISDSNHLPSISTCTQTHKLTQSHITSTSTVYIEIYFPKKITIHILFSLKLLIQTIFFFISFFHPHPFYRSLSSFLFIYNFTIFPSITFRQFLSPCQNKNSSRQNIEEKYQRKNNLRATKNVPLNSFL